MKGFYFVYVLQSDSDGRFYTGYTSNLERRLQQHHEGEVSSTKHRRPFKLVYFEGCLNQADALHREKYLKTTYGKRYLRNRMKQALDLSES